MSKVLLFFTIVIGVITGSFGECPPGQVGDIILCRSPGRNLCDKIRNLGDCFNVFEYTYYSGFVNGETTNIDCIWYTEKNCKGFTGRFTRDGFDGTFPYAIRSLACKCRL